MKDVFLIQDGFLNKTGDALKKIGIDKIKKGEKVAIKVHYGEYGNMNYIRPSIVGKIVEVIKSTGAKPFLVETVMPSFSESRNSKKKLLDTARKHGFTEETIGCPIIVSEDGIEKETKSGKLKFSKEILEADILVVISHCKGHSEAGFGGAIKNIGMGSLIGEEKIKVHMAAKVEISDKCDSCKKCLQSCKFNAISMKEKASIDYSLCFGCGACIKVCPKHAIIQKVNFRDLVRDNAEIMINNFKKTFFVNVLFDITPLCDCFPIGGMEAGFPICNDIGILVSDDAFAIDKVSLDLIKKEAGKDILFQVEHIHSEELLGEKKIDYKLTKL